VWISGVELLCLELEPCQIGPKEVESLLALAISTEVGNGAITMFWQDKWLDGRSIKDMAPHLYALVPKRRENRRIFLEALSNEQWLEIFKETFQLQPYSSTSLYGTF
jgi:hypothetical protein